MNKEGFIYLVKRDKTNLKILARTEVDSFIKNPDPFSLIKDKLLAKGTSETIKQNILNWESYAENGTIEQILENWRKKGFNFKIGKYSPLIKPISKSNLVSKIHNFGRRL